MSKPRKKMSNSFTLSPNKNNRLVTAIRDAGYSSIRDFADLAGLGYTTVNRLVHKDHTYSEEWMQHIYCVMADLGKLFHELFDVEEYERYESRLPVGVERAEAVFADRTEADAADIVAEKHLQREVDKAMSGLTPRERFVLDKRYGLTGSEMTLEEVGVCMEITRERVRQIEMKALRKLRHPARTVAVRSFLKEPRYDIATEEMVATYVSPTRANIYVPPIRVLPKPTPEYIAAKPEVVSPPKVAEVVKEPAAPKPPKEFVGKGWGFKTSVDVTETSGEKVREIVVVPKDDLDAFFWLQGLFDYTRHPESLNDLNNYNRVSITLLEKYLGLKSPPMSLHEISSWTRLFMGHMEGLTLSEVREHIASAAMLIDQHIRGRVSVGVQGSIRKLLRSKLMHDYNESAVEMLAGSAA